MSTALVPTITTVVLSAKLNDRHYTLQLFTSHRAMVQWLRANATKLEHIEAVYTHGSRAIY